MIRYTTSLDGIDVDQLIGGFWVGWPTPPTPQQHLAMLRGAEVAVVAMDGDEGGVVGYITAIGEAS